MIGKLFSGQMGLPFELFYSTNPQNDRIWCRKSSKVAPQEKVKFPPKVLVWGMMSNQALSELHIIPPKQTVNASYYVSEILAKTCKEAALKEIGNRYNSSTENDC